MIREEFSEGKGMGERRVKRSNNRKRNGGGRVIRWECGEGKGVGER